MTDGMNLDEYVKETLLAIVRGVVSAQSDATAGQYVGRAPNAPPRGGSALPLGMDWHDNPITLVSFDVATTVSEASSGGGGVGIKVVPLFSLSGNIKNETGASLVSRIAFQVPVSMPMPAQQRLADQEFQNRINSANSRYDSDTGY
jgi:hypothetical protein